jgi:hypothetical protein
VGIINRLTARFAAPGEPPMQALARWRSSRPEWLPAAYREIEDSYKSVTWEWRHTGALMKLVGGGLFGGQEVYRITALFDDDGAGGSRITVNGQADEDTRAAIRAAAESYVEGGIV